MLTAPNSIQHNELMHNYNLLLFQPAHLTAESLRERNPLRYYLDFMHIKQVFVPPFLINIPK